MELTALYVNTDITMSVPYWPISYGVSVLVYRMRSSRQARIDFLHNPPLRGCHKWKLPVLYVNRDLTMGVLYWSISYGVTILVYRMRSSRHARIDFLHNTRLRNYRGVAINGANCTVRK